MAHEHHHEEEEILRLQESYGRKLEMLEQYLNDTTN